MDIKTKIDPIDCSIFPYSSKSMDNEKLLKELPQIADAANQLATSVMDQASVALDNGSRLCNFTQNLYDTVLANQVYIDPTDIKPRSDFDIENVPNFSTVAPVFRLQKQSESGQWSEINSVLANPELASCFDEANQKLAAVLKATIESLDKYSQSLAQSYRNFCNYCCVYNNIERYLKSVPEIKPFMIPNCGLTTLYSLMNLTKVSKKDFDEAKSNFLTALNSSNTVPTEYKEFWKKLSGPAAATAYLHQIINIESQESCAENLSFLYSKLSKLLNLLHWVSTAEENLFDLGPQYEPSEMIKNYVPLYAQFIDDLSMSKWSLTNLAMGQDYTAESIATFNKNILGTSEEAHEERGGRPTQLYLEGPSNAASDDHQAIATDYGDSLKEIDFTFFNNLISPLSSILLKKGLTFEFSNMDYNYEIGSEHETFTQFLNNTTTFDSIESILHLFFDQKYSEKYQEMCNTFFDHLIPCFYMVAKSIEYTDQPEKNLKGLFETNEQWLTPVVLSWREVSFFMMYVAAKRNKPDLKVATTSLLNIADSFLLQPHVQILMLYTFSYLKKVLKGRGGELNDYSTEEKGKDHIIRLIADFVDTQTLSFTTTSYNYNINHLLLQYIFIKISDFIFQTIKVDSVNVKNDLDVGVPLAREMKTFGHYNIDSIETLFTLLPYFVSSTKINESSLQCPIWASVNPDTNLLFSTVVQITNLVLLATNQITLKNLMDQPCSLFRQVNKNIAFFLFMAHTNLARSAAADNQPEEDRYSNLLSFGACKSVPSEKCKNLLALLWPQISKKYNRAYEIKDRSNLKLTPVKSSWLAQQYTPGRYDKIFTSSPKVAKSSIDVLVSDTNLEHRGLRPIQGFNWFSPPLDDELNMFILEETSMPPKSRQLAQLGEDLICCNAASDPEKLNLLYDFLNDKYPRGWWLNVYPGEDGKTIFEVKNGSCSGQGGGAEVLFSCNWEDDVIKLNDDSTGESVSHEMAYGKRKRTGTDESDLEEDLAETTKKVCQAKFYSVIPSLADFVTSFKQPSMPNTEFQQIDFEKLRSDFQPESITNLLNIYSSSEDQNGTSDQNLKYTNVFKNYFLASNLLEKYTDVNKTFTQILTNYCKDCSQLIMFSIWSKIALHHFYKYPTMYIFNNPSSDANAVAAQVDKILISNAGCFYVNMAEFFEIIKQKRDRFDDVPFLRSWFYCFEMNTNLSKPYIYLFEPVHLLRSNTTNFYLGIIAIFTLYWLENNETIFPRSNTITP